MRTPREEILANHDLRSDFVDFVYDRHGAARVEHYNSTVIPGSEQTPAMMAVIQNQWDERFEATNEAGPEGDAVDFALAVRIGYNAELKRDKDRDWTSFIGARAVEKAVEYLETPESIREQLGLLATLVKPNRANDRPNGVRILPKSFFEPPMTTVLYGKDEKSGREKPIAVYEERSFFEGLANNSRYVRDPEVVESMTRQLATVSRLALTVDESLAFLNDTLERAMRDNRQ
jgi:hypothetical protein